MDDRGNPAMRPVLMIHPMVVVRHSDKGRRGGRNDREYC